ncbi:hypothetical protein A5663_19130 [Mycobacterium sp. E740]|nr:hypothetical protein A5663_19130 [Mycobacterium sp. E740]
MTQADVRNDAPVARDSGGVLTVQRRTASCTCRWEGRHRLLRSFAVHDALMHAAQSRCRPGVPLVCDKPPI